MFSEQQAAMVIKAAACRLHLLGSVVQCSNLGVLQACLSCNLRWNLL
jgi:hypothetical protein